MSRLVKEVIFTSIFYIVLLALFLLVIKERVILSDEGLSTIGLALSTALGVLTAIVVSFVLITWQASRQERSTSFWRWKDALIQLFDSFDSNAAALNEIGSEIITITSEAAAAALIKPMPRERLKELIPLTLEKIGVLLEGLKNKKIFLKPMK